MKKICLMMGVSLLLCGCGPQETRFSGVSRAKVDLTLKLFTVLSENRDLRQGKVRRGVNIDDLNAKQLDSVRDLSEQLQAIYDHSDDRDVASNIRSLTRIQSGNADLTQIKLHLSKGELQKALDKNKVLHQRNPDNPQFASLSRILPKLVALPKLLQMLIQADNAGQLRSACENIRIRLGRDMTPSMDKLLAQYGRKIADLEKHDSGKTKDAERRSLQISRSESKAEAERNAENKRVQQMVVEHVVAGEEARKMGGDVQPEDL